MNTPIIVRGFEIPPADRNPSYPEVDIKVAELVIPEVRHMLAMEAMRAWREGYGMDQIIEYELRIEAPNFAARRIGPPYAMTEGDRNLLGGQYEATLRDALQGNKSTTLRGDSDRAAERIANVASAIGRGIGHLWTQGYINNDELPGTMIIELQPTPPSAT